VAWSTVCLQAESPHDALLLACQARDVAAASKAIALGANVNYRCFHVGKTETPLGEAFSTIEPALADLLLQNGADPWLSMERVDEVPGCVAARNQHPRVGQILNKLGTGRSMVLIQTVAQNLSLAGNVEAVKSLTASGLTPEFVTEKGGTPFFWALTGGHPQAAEELLRWAAPRLEKRFDKNLDASQLVNGIAEHPWNEAAAVRMVEEMFRYGVQFFVPDDQPDDSPGSLANQRRLPMLAKRLGWTGELCRPMTPDDLAVVAARHASPELRLSLYQAAKQAGSNKDLESRMLASYLSRTGKFDASEAKRWLQLKADLNAVVEIPNIGKTTATAMLLTADVSEVERAARLQWLTEQGAKPYENLRISSGTSLPALKSLYVWAKPPSVEKSEEILSALILWHAEDRHWSPQLRAILAFFCEQKASLAKTPAAKDALAVLARRPEPRLLAKLDTKKLHQEVVQKYRAPANSKFVGNYIATVGVKSASLTLHVDGMAELNIGDTSTYGTWVQEETLAPTATLNTPIRSYFLRAGLEGAMEVRLIRYKHAADYVFEPFKPAAELPAAQAQEAKPDSSTLISFQEQHLTELPATGTDWVNARSVTLARNRLQSLPEALLDATSLQYLDASQNWLTSLKILKPLLSLHALNLAGNGFTEDQPWLRMCPRLRELNLANNRLRRCPTEVSSLANLEKLNLSGNLLNAVPPQTWRMVSLQEVSLAGNDLKSIPSELLASSIQTLDLSHNQISYESLRGPIFIKKIILTGNGFTANQMASLERRYPHIIWGKAEVAEKYDTVATK
jgi:hypothetical protein